MLLEVTPKTGNREGNGKGEKELSNLVSCLNTLSIEEQPSKEVKQLEYDIAKVSLIDEKDDNNIKEEVETSKKEILPETPEKVASDDEKESKRNEEEPERKEAEKEETEKVSDEKDTEVTSSQDAEKDDKVITDSTESEKEKDSKEEKEAEETSSKDVSDSDNESSSDNTAPNESAPLVKEKKEKFLRRGFGAGTQNEQHYSYSMYQTNYGNFQCEPPAVAPISYASQLTMSPQQAMSPGYSNMPVSPVPGYTESMYMQNGDGYFDNGMSSFLGSPALGVDPYWIPDTPPSPVRDDSDLLGLITSQSLLGNTTGDGMEDDLDLLGLITSQSPSIGHSAGDVLEAIARVESHPTGSVPPEKLIPLKTQLFGVLDKLVPGDLSSLLSGSNVECQVDSEHNGNLQSCLMDYPNILSPPAEDDLAENSAEMEIRSHLDEAQYRKTLMRMAVITNEALTEKDSEGDNPCLVVACKDESSPRFYENLVAMVERARAIDVCCEKPVSREKRCVVCGNTNQSTFYSPFAMRNNEGDTMLSSVIRAQQPQLVINYICENICHRQSDVKLIFGGQNAEFYHSLTPRYPILSRFLSFGF